MTITQQPSFTRFNEDIIISISDFLEHPREILVLRELYATATLGLKEKDEIQRFVEQKEYWVSYFQRMFSSVPAVVNNVQKGCTNLCRKVCELASRFYEFGNPYQLAVETQIETQAEVKEGVVLCDSKNKCSEVERAKRRINLKEILASGYEQCVIHYTLYQDFESVFRGGIENFPPLVGHRHAVYEQFITMYSDELYKFPQIQLWCFHLKNKELLDKLIHTNAAPSSEALRAIIECDNIEMLSSYLASGKLEFFPIPFRTINNGRESLLSLPLFFAAVLYDAPKTITLLIERNGDLATMRVLTNITPLHWACSEAIARILMHKGAEITATDLENNTPLHTALQNGKEKVAQFLIQNGAPLDVKNMMGFTPVDLAGARGWTIERTAEGYSLKVNDPPAAPSTEQPVVQSLLDPNAAEVAVEIEDTPANRQLWITYFQTLLSKDPSIFEKCMLPYTNLCDEIYKLVSHCYGCTDPEKVSLELQIDKERLQSQFHELFPQMLNAGYEQFFIHNHNVLTSIEWCIEDLMHLMRYGLEGLHRHEASKILLKLYHSQLPYYRLQKWSFMLNDRVLFQDSVKNNGLGDKIMRWIVTDDDVEAIIPFLENGVENGQLSLEQVKSLLSQAIESDAKTIIALLFDKGIAPYLSDHEKYRLLFESVRNSSKDVVALLIHHGAPVNGVPSGSLKNAPLHTVSCTDIAQLLLEKGADIEARNIEQETPLHCAVQDEMYDWAKLLIEKGANIHAVTSEGKTALDLAKSEEMKHLLQKRKAETPPKDEPATKRQKM